MAAAAAAAVVEAAVAGGGEVVLTMENETFNISLHTETGMPGQVHIMVGCREGRYVSYPKRNIKVLACRRPQNCVQVSSVGCI